MADQAAPLGALGGGPNPDELLAQIQALLQQYLALGPDTPVANEAQALSAAIDGTMGGGDMGGGLGGLGDMGAEPPIDGESLEEPPPNTTAKTYDEANKTATERLKRRNRQ